MRSIKFSEDSQIIGALVYSVYYLYTTEVFNIITLNATNGGVLTSYGTTWGDTVPQMGLAFLGYQLFVGFQTWTT